MTTKEKNATSIGVVSLGCSKNRVDTEVMLGILRDEGYMFVPSMADADVILINTCAFIADAREEALGVILEAGQQKRYGSVKAIVVTGCFPERYRERLRQMAPEVDVFLGTAAYKDISRAIQDALANNRVEYFPDLKMTEKFDRRVITTAKPTAYVKIAEGCDNGCTYCVIPQVRGRFQSRTVESIEEEVTNLVNNGYSEIVLVAQDTTKYGKDLYGRPVLPQLLRRLASIRRLKWLRLLYAYPEGITDQLLEVMSKHDNIVKYLDMPVQHMSNAVLKRMNRNTTYESILETVERIRAAHPDFIIRSTVIVGFPGETRDDYYTLLKGLRKVQFDRLGVFPYSREEGTAAALMDHQIDDNTKESRFDTIMNDQAPISYVRNRKRIGRQYDILIEGYDPKTKLYYGRSYAEAPEVDGLVFIRHNKLLENGRYYPARIIQALNYDCRADIVDEVSEEKSK